MKPKRKNVIQRVIVLLAVLATLCSWPAVSGSLKGPAEMILDERLQENSISTKAVPDTSKPAASQTQAVKDENAEELSKKNVWDLSNWELWPKIFNTCGEKHSFTVNSSAFNDCILSLMSDAGAPKEAVQFTKEMKSEVYMGWFLELGKVDLAETVHPLLNDPWVSEFILVNGMPKIVNPWEHIRHIDITRDPLYHSLSKKFPEVEIWSAHWFVSMDSLLDGGQEFIFYFILLNGCRACEPVGSAEIAFDFGKDGIFKGTKLLKLVQGGAEGLSFPLECADKSCAFRYTKGAYTPKSITSVLDHHMDNPYINVDGTVLAFTGEKGKGTPKNQGCYPKDGGGVFSISGLYRGTNDGCLANQGLNYDNHPGYDYIAEVGTPVRAAASGKVVNIQNKRENGNAYQKYDICVPKGIDKQGCSAWGFVGIDHGNRYVTQYGHLSKIFVYSGDTVKKGHIIGLSGNTSPFTLGPHLHFEVLKEKEGAPYGYTFVDPYGWATFQEDYLTDLSKIPNFELWDHNPIGKANINEDVKLYQDIAKKEIKDGQTVYPEGYPIGNAHSILKKGDSVEVIRVIPNDSESKHTLLVIGEGGRWGYVHRNGLQLNEPYGDKGAILSIHLQTPYEYEDDIKLVDNDIKKYQNFTDQYADSIFVPEALANMTYLHIYTLQFSSIEEKLNRLEEIKKIYKKLFTEYENTSWIPKAKDAYNYLSELEIDSIDFEELHLKLLKYQDTVSETIPSSLSSPKDE